MIFLPTFSNTAWRNIYFMNPFVRVFTIKYQLYLQVALAEKTKKRITHTQPRFRKTRPPEIPKKARIREYFIWIFLHSLYMWGGGRKGKVAFSLHSKGSGGKDLPPASRESLHHRNIETRQTSEDEREVAEPNKLSEWRLRERFRGERRCREKGNELLTREREIVKRACKSTAKSGFFGS